MPLLIAAIAWMGFIAYLLTRSIRQYGYFQVLAADATPANAALPLITVVIPARNEAENLERCLEGLLRQDYPPERYRMIVVDDHSTDATGALAMKAAAQDDRLTVIRSNPLPAGWTGKAHACWQGAAAAGATDWLCFIDADTSSETVLLKTATREAIRRDLGLLSLSPFQDLVGVWERLIMPAGFFLLAFTQDLRAANDPHTMNVHANGQFLLIRKSAYDAAGGFAAVATKIAEDSALARAVKAAGYRVALLGTDGLIRTRMYSEFPALWEGLARQASELLGSSVMSLLWAAGALVLGWAAPALPVCAALAVARQGPALVPILALSFSLAGSLALLGTHIGAAKYFRIPIIYGILFPLSYTLGAGVLFTAAVERRRGRVKWKGRAYPSASPTTPPQGSA